MFKDIFPEEDHRFIYRGPKKKGTPKPGKSADAKWQDYPNPIKFPRKKRKPGDHITIEDYAGKKPKAKPKAKPDPKAKGQAAIEKRQRAIKGKPEAKPKLSKSRELLGYMREVEIFLEEWIYVLEQEGNITDPKERTKLIRERLGHYPPNLVKLWGNGSLAEAKAVLKIVREDTAELERGIATASPAAVERRVEMAMGGLTLEEKLDQYVSDLWDHLAKSGLPSPKKPYKAPKQTKRHEKVQRPKRRDIVGEIPKRKIERVRLPKNTEFFQAANGEVVAYDSLGDMIMIRRGGRFFEEMERVGFDGTTTKHKFGIENPSTGKRSTIRRDGDVLTLHGRKFRKVAPPMRTVQLRRLPEIRQVEYFFRLESGEKLLVSVPKYDYEYENFQLSINGRIIPIERVARRRDGGSTIIRTKEGVLNVPIRGKATWKGEPIF